VVEADDIAGGFDALFLLIIDTPQVLDSVQDLWEGWTEMSVCPLSARQSDGGLVKVDLEQVKGLKEGIAVWCGKAKA
jgi:phosphomevalonate kinase